MLQRKKKIIFLSPEWPFSWYSCKSAKNERYKNGSACVMPPIATDPSNIGWTDFDHTVTISWRQFPSAFWKLVTKRQIFVKYG